MIDKNFKNHIKNLVEDDLIIVSFCNKLYKHIALNWVAHLQLLNINNYIVIATDRETEKYLIKHKINTYYLRGTLSRRSGSGWKWRTEALRNILYFGFDVIHSDLDTIWLKDTRYLITSNYDMVVSRDDAGFPKYVSEKWGFAICPGWLFLRPTASCFLMLNEICSNKKDFDDQKEINEYLFDMFGENYTMLVDNSVELTCSEINVRVVSPDLLVRGDFVKGCYACHPYMRKSSDCKSQLQRRDFWII